MLLVKKSIIPNGGMGLRTTSRIRKGDLIVEYKGEKLTWEQCLKRYKEDISFARYLFYISYKNCVDAQRTPEALARYANDANGFSKVKGLKNNSEYKIVKGKPYIVATKDIPANSEIFVDYAGDYWEAMKEEYERREKEEKKKKEKAAQVKKKTKKRK
jgi:uncharacterized protein